MTASDYSVFSEYLDYSPDTGVLIWKLRNSNRCVVGREAGFVNPLGYRCLGFRGKQYLSHRVAWLLYYRSWPSGFIDHKDGNRSNNKIDNLRLCTKSQNNRNRMITGGSSKYKGVCWDSSKGLWMASIYLDGKNKYLGRFTSEREAAGTYDAAAKEHFGEWARLNFEALNEKT